MWYWSIWYCKSYMVLTFFFLFFFVFLLRVNRLNHQPTGSLYLLNEPNGAHSFSFKIFDVRPCLIISTTFFSFSASLSSCNNLCSQLSAQSKLSRCIIESYAFLLGLVRPDIPLTQSVKTALCGKLEDTISKLLLLPSIINAPSVLRDPLTSLQGAILDNATPSKISVYIYVLHFVFAYLLGRSLVVYDQPGVVYKFNPYDPDSNKDDDQIPFIMCHTMDTNNELCFMAFNTHVTEHTLTNKRRKKLSKSPICYLPIYESRI